MQNLESKDQSLMNFALWIGFRGLFVLLQMNGVKLGGVKHLSPDVSQVIKKWLNIWMEEYHEFMLKASPTPLISIEEFQEHSNQEDSTNLLEILAKPGEKDPFDLLSMQQMKNKLSDAVSELDEREQLVLSLYYQEEMNLKEIGEILGVIESRVSQIRTKSILKLRAKLRLMTRDGI